jgi:hypothetical protein
VPFLGKGLSLGDAVMVLGILSRSSQGFISVLTREYRGGCPGDLVVSPASVADYAE